MRTRDRHGRRRPRTTFRPRAEGLEPRIALSADIGVNIGANWTYNDNPMWTDLHNLASPWQPASGSTVALTADGYPLANASTSFTLTNYPAGNYQFSYTGGGTVSFGGIGQLVGPVTTSGGVTTGTVAVGFPAGNNGLVTMQVTNVNTASPMDNFHLMMPGYGNGTTPEPMFTPAFLAAVKPFSDLRFMDMENINNSKLANWQDRVQPNAFITDQSGGVPYEDMIEMCNEAQKDMWINIPALATPQFVQGLAQLIAAKLDPNLNVYVEYGNEDWNYGFAAYGQIGAAALANPILNHSLGTYQLTAQQTAYTLVTDGQVFDQAFGTGAARVRPILGGQAAWNPFQTDELQFIQQEFGPPSQYVYALAIAPYVGASGTITGNTSLATLFSDIDSFISSQYMPWITSNAALAKQYGVALAAYEGGQSLVPHQSSGPLFNLEDQAQNDPRMYQVYLTMMQDWEQVGGGPFDMFGLTGYPGMYGYYGMLTNVSSPGSQKFDSVLSMLLPAADANDDGIVDDADFQAVQAHFDSGGTTYWSQGDFNDDGVTNAADLNILRQDLNPAGFTLAQFAQQAVFGEPATVDSPTALEYDGYGVAYASDLSLSSTSGTVRLDQDSLGTPIVLGGAAYAKGLGFAGNSSTSIALAGRYSRFDSTIGVDGAGSTASSVVFQVFGDGNLLYQSPVESSGAAAVPIDVNVAGVQKLTLVVEAASGSTVANDHAVWADARLISTANFGSTTPYTLTWQLAQNGQVVATQAADSFAFAALSGTYTLTLTVADAQSDQATASTTVTVIPDVPKASLNSRDTATEGNWIGTYGFQGDEIAGEGASLPVYASISVSGASTYTWSDSTTDARALGEPDGVGAAATAWDGNSFTINVNLGDGQPHYLALYAVDWDNQGRSEQIQLINPATGSVMDTETLSSFVNGAYLQWSVSGSVEIKVTRLAGVNAVVSGLFLNGVPAFPAVLRREDTATQGNWTGNYGSQGYDIEGVGASLPSSDTVAVSGASTYAWQSVSTAASALQVPGGSSRIAATWYSTSSFTIDVDLGDGQSHLLSLYALDWDQRGRSEQIQLIDAATGSVIDTETLSSFTGGAYLQWSVSGNMQIKVTCLAGANAVVSGVFIDPA